MAFPALPPEGDTSWYDWATALHSAGSAVVDAATLAETIRDRIASTLVAGANVTVTPDDVADTVTIAATAGSAPDATTTSKGVIQLAGDLAGTAAAPTVSGLAGKLDTSAAPELIRDTMGTALVAGSNATVTPNDAGDTITVAVPDATTTTKGAVELATTAEATTGTDTVRAVTPAGVKAVADTKANALTTVNSQATAYTLVLGDGGALVEMTGASAVALTVPPNSSVAFPVGTTVVVRQYGAGQVTLTAGAGVTIRSRGGALKLAGQYAECTLSKRGTDEWVASGDLSA